MVSTTNKAPKLAVPIEDFFATCLLFFGEPFDIGGNCSQGYYFTHLDIFLKHDPRGQKFTQCVIQCGGSGKSWAVNNLHQLYKKWYRRASRRVDNARIRAKREAPVQTPCDQPRPMDVAPNEESLLRRVSGME